MVSGNTTVKGHASRLWDSEIGNLIKNRKLANKFYRYWSKKGHCNPDLVQNLWHEYLDRNHTIQEKIKAKMVDDKIKVIAQNSKKGAKNTRAYWRMLKRLNSSNDYPIRILDPCDNTRYINDPKEISRVLGEYWQGLGTNNNKCISNRSYSDNVLAQRVNELHSLTGQPDGLTDVSIDFDKVESAIKRLKLGKACGVDNIPNEFLKHGGHTIITTLVELFNFSKLMESFPDQWYKGFVKPLHKGGSRENLSNYHGITIASNVYKLVT